MKKFFINLLASIDVIAGVYFALGMATWCKTKFIGTMVRVTNVSTGVSYVKHMCHGSVSTLLEYVIGLIVIAVIFAGLRMWTNHLNERSEKSEG